MYNSQAQAAKLEFNVDQIRAGAIMLGVGGVIAFAGAAVAGLAIASAFQRRDAADGRAADRARAAALVGGQARDQRRRRRMAQGAAGCAAPAGLAAPARLNHPAGVMRQAP